MFDHHDLSPEMFKAKFSNPSKMLHRCLLWLEKRTYATADHAMVTNHSYERYAIKRDKFDPDRITVVRSGPSSDRFEITPPLQEVRSAAEHILVFLGEIGEQDGVENLVDSVEILGRRRSDFICLIIGDGPNLQSIKQRVTDKHLQKYFDFRGRITDDLELSQLLSSADIGVVPDPNTDWSRFSTMNKVMEYMFFELPVVAFDLVETRFTAQECASYAAADDVEHFAKQLEALMQEETKRKMMGEKGRARLLDSLSWESSAPNLLAAYKQMLDS